MAYSSTIKLVVGDTLPELNFTLKTVILQLPVKRWTPMIVQHGLL